MMFKLGQCTEKNWQRLRGFDYLAKVITGNKFRDCIDVTKVNQAASWLNHLNTTFDNTPHKLVGRITGDLPEAKTAHELFF